RSRDLPNRCFRPSSTASSACRASGPRGRKGARRMRSVGPAMEASGHPRTARGKIPMICAWCRSDNLPGRKFCSECGRDLASRPCAACGATNQARDKFCGACGEILVAATAFPPEGPRSYTPAHLAERILAERTAMEARGSAYGERKNTTAMFADIKGSVELMEGLDPEDARSIVDPALEIMMEAVHRYDGYVARPTGDGVFALFGAPIACEDHPRRALHAALRMQQEIRGYTAKLRAERGLSVEIRIGLNTGEVV